jgi:neutral ceramidase
MRGKVRPTPLEAKADKSLENGKYGDVVDDAKPEYHAGDRAVASFRSGNPQNGFRPDRQYAAIEKKAEGAWQPVAVDGDWEVKIRWKNGVATIEWTIPKDTKAGEYRMVHHGFYKTDDGQLHTFDATSRTFDVR